ncbi:unnamed protein product [Adineta steineri]|uniref:Uncharacterized protein n=1 Tax=Adineta steineri TaxID=433720 RepID=A0A814U507_9BILA|nr:unnamed protein product [Adineta steineri]CAF1076718.1 unnamed protein product [Adineta steineri]CAF1169088.1 unnamed protein product [Adineta steineri]CAF3523632.1 unnamed protein product [Adineta steineri]CAF3766170.1 unnamed protein product [Adineta steineri]
MHILTILPFFLLILLSNPKQTIGKTDCRCECCTSQNCNPTLIGTHNLWFCSETTSCTKSECINWHPASCPREDASGQTRAICVSNAERRLPMILSLFACFFKVFFPHNPRHSLQKIDHPLWNTTTTIIVPIRRPSTMPQIRLDWLEKFGLIKKTSTSTMATNLFKQRF